MSDLQGPYLNVDPDLCTACRTCELACAAAHTKAGTLMGAVLTGEPLYARNKVIQVAEVKLPTQCRQCEDAPCVKVCPTGATYREATYTAVRTELCIACKLCVMVCPFGAIHVTTLEVNGKQKRVATKCDICINREDGPACVEACPTKAITIAHPKAVAFEAMQASAERFVDAIRTQKTLEKSS